jgi:crotonobetainyl-CoA:carnitine CoA-transferase CaiB-like acyl-CoA transferase
MPRPPAGGCCDFGAEVTKVETRRRLCAQWTHEERQSMGFARLNAGKRSVGIDVRSEAGRDLVRRLAADVDVVIESFRPGRLEAWGLGYDVLSVDNPRLVLTRVSGFGQTGPYSGKPGFGTVAETGSGFAFINGWPETPPTSPPFGFADSIAGISAAMGTAMALYRRERTGAGDVVDVALYEPLMFIIGDMIINYTGTGFVQGRVGNGTGSASPRGVYQAADGKWLSIAASNQGIAIRLFHAMGRPDILEDPRFATNAARMEHNDAIQAIVSAWVAARPRHEVLAVLDEHEVVCSQVNDASDIVADPHFSERTLVELTEGRLDGATPGRSCIWVVTTAPCMPVSPPSGNTPTRCYSPPGWARPSSTGCGPKASSAAESVAGLGWAGGLAELGWRPLLGSWELGPGQRAWCAVACMRLVTLG